MTYSISILFTKGKIILSIDVRYKFETLIYKLRKKVLSRPRNCSPLSRFIGRKVLSYRPNTLPSLDPQPLLNVTLGLTPWDGYGTEITVQFLEDGTVSRIAKHSRASESTDFLPPSRSIQERFNQEDGMVLYQKLLALNTQTWKKHYRHYDVIMDGMEWRLTIENLGRYRREYGGGMMFPPEWHETCALFGIESSDSDDRFILSD